jgi:hypothetical protein
VNVENLGLGSFTVGPSYLMEQGSWWTLPPRSTKSTRDGEARAAARETREETAGDERLGERDAE